MYTSVELTARTVAAYAEGREDAGDELRRLREQLNALANVISNATPEEIAIWFEVYGGGEQ